jgi:hypothetical protein
MAGWRLCSPVKPSSSSAMSTSVQPACRWRYAMHASRCAPWLLAMRILDDKLWAQVKNGELTGLSKGGSAVGNPA